jgi:hypothetical protein
MTKKVLGAGVIVTQSNQVGTTRAESPDDPRGHALSTVVIAGEQRLAVRAIEIHGGVANGASF